MYPLEQVLPVVQQQQQKNPCCGIIYFLTIASEKTLDFNMQAFMALENN